MFAVVCEYVELFMMELGIIMIQNCTHAPESEAEIKFKLMFFSEDGLTS